MAGTAEDLEGTVWSQSEDGLLETAGSRGAVRVLHSSLWGSQPRRASASVSWKVLERPKIGPPFLSEATPRTENIPSNQSVRITPDW